MGTVFYLAKIYLRPGGVCQEEGTHDIFHGDRVHGLGWFQGPELLSYNFVAQSPWVRVDVLPQFPPAADLSFIYGSTQLLFRGLVFRRFDICLVSFPCPLCSSSLFQALSARFRNIWSPPVCRSLAVARSLAQYDGFANQDRSVSVAAFPIASNASVTFISQDIVLLKFPASIL